MFIGQDIKASTSEQVHWERHKSYFLHSLVCVVVLVQISKQATTQNGQVLPINSAPPAQ